MVSPGELTDGRQSLRESLMCMCGCVHECEHVYMCLSVHMCMCVCESMRVPVECPDTLALPFVLFLLFLVSLHHGSGTVHLLISLH